MAGFKHTYIAMKDLTIYFLSCGLGENLQASSAMRHLKRTRHILLVAREPLDLVIHPDCYDEILTWRPGTEEDAAHRIKLKTASLDGPAPWTCHLDPPAWCAELERGGFIVEQRHEFPKVPRSAARAFWWRITGAPVEGDLLMSAKEPERKMNGDYDVLVCLGSGEKMRRLPERIAVDLCNRLRMAGKRVGLVTHGNRPDKLHSKIGCVINRWNAGTLEQLKEVIWGVQTVVSPDSGPVHLALAYGKHVVFLESREHARDVVDAVYDDKLHVVRMTNPKCDLRCHARRPDVAAWPKEPASLMGKEYPMGLACNQEAETPCLKFDNAMIEEIIKFVP